MYGKIENGKLKFVPKIFYENDMMIVGGTPTFYKSHGYKEVIFSDYPEDEKFYNEIYIETENEIIVNYVEDIDGETNE